MGIELQKLVATLDQLLQPTMWKDFCPNGLQVQGKKQINQLVTGVTACQALLDEAIAVQADAILVHHGYFWQGEAPELVGPKFHRIKTLIENNVSLLAYHLPLDGHPVYGNNAQLANLLDFETVGKLELDSGNSSGVGSFGRLKQPMSGSELANVIEDRLNRTPLHIDVTNQLKEQQKIETIGWCTGGAQGMIGLAIDMQLDAYLTGEASEQTFHQAQEAGIHFYAAGHHATERYGVQAVGEYLAGVLDIEHRFIDIDNPV
ncbi:MAG: Nif3-like dinuclear metal center hexameric protein [Pseudomonadales bacterium]|nr:Nif3-like dinuclear metal center hexameric protein [Pseudomonadales bacterium]